MAEKKPYFIEIEAGKTFYRVDDFCHESRPSKPCIERNYKGKLYYREILPRKSKKPFKVREFRVEDFGYSWYSWGNYFIIFLR